MARREPRQELKILTTTIGWVTSEADIIIKCASEPVLDAKQPLSGLLLQAILQLIHLRATKWPFGPALRTGLR